VRIIAQVGLLDMRLIRAHCAPVAANSATRFGDLIKQRRNGADGAFFVSSVCARARFYGGRVGQPSGWPVSFVAGSPTLHVRHLAATARWLLQHQLQRWSMTMNPKNVAIAQEFGEIPVHQR